MIDHANISPAHVLVSPLKIVPRPSREREAINRKRNYFLVKRCFDIVLSVFFIVCVLSWLLPILCLLVKLSSKGPVFFLQRRVGRGGKSFTCYKLRTMVINDLSDTQHATEEDNRITHLGRFLRKSNIDEFPQFFNILKGDMSVIGPRPHMHADCNRFSAVQQGYKSRNMVKPGLTGLAQVKGYHGPTTTRNCILMRYHWDTYYIHHIGWLLDGKIMLHTIAQKIHAIGKYLVSNIITRHFEKVKLQHRAEKYLYKEDRGGITYLRRTVQKGDIVFDIGAHKAGYLYFFLEQLGETGKIFAFEPQSILYKYLLKLKKIFNWKNVVLESSAVSDQSGKAVLCVPYNSGRLSSPCATIIESHTHFDFRLREEVNTVSLDEYCRRYCIFPDFLKIDVEGNELSVLKGAKQVLQIAKPKILFECEARFVGAEKVLETLCFLEQAGYQGYFIMGGEMLPIEDFDLSIHQHTGTGTYCNNFIFE